MQAGRPHGLAAAVTDEHEFDVVVGVPAESRHGARPDRQPGRRPCDLSNRRPGDLAGVRIAARDDTPIPPPLSQHDWTEHGKPISRRNSETMTIS